jgi:PAS domain S-box-containing protein
LDTTEDFIGALIPMWWAFVFYAFLHETASLDLRTSEERLRSILNSVQAGIVIIDPENHITVDVNPVAAQMIGAPKEQIVGKLCHKHICPAEKGECPITDLGQKMDKSERLLLKADGRTVPILKTVVSVSLGGREHLLESFLDITERKRAENALRASEEKYRSLVESTEDSVYLIDVDLTYLFMNEKHLSRFGLPENKVIGRKYEEFHSEKETKAFAEKVDMVVKTGRSLWHEYTSLRDGRHFLRTMSPVEGEDKRTLAVTVISKDVTERKHLEAQLQHSQRMEAIGTLAGGIAHDFNNVLMGIQGHTSLMLLRMDSDHRHFGHVQGIENMVQRGADLTRQLLGFARGGKYEVKPTDLNELVENSSEMFGRTRKEIRIHTEYEKDLWPVEVDQAQIEQVLLNLYVNAWQAMPDGGDLYVETNNGVLDENYTRPFAVQSGDYVRISVTDTGVGMDQATQERIFDPFFTTKEIARGTGLGLSSAYGIIKNHGGIINVSSEMGKGTTFNIYLPASKKEVTTKDKWLAEEILKGTGTILLVDDEEVVVDVGGEMLKEMGYTVLTARSGKEAVEVYTKHKEEIHIVVLDMIMPDMGGGEAYDTMKELNPKVKVLLSSGYSINGQATEILNRGCNGFIQKPFSMKELSGRIREILEQN